MLGILSIGDLAGTTKATTSRRRMAMVSPLVGITASERGYLWNGDQGMLTIRPAILGLALLLAMIGDSSGQSHPEPPRQNPGGAQQQTNTEKRDTDQAPSSAIKILPAEQTQPKPIADEQNAERCLDSWRQNCGHCQYCCVAPVFRSRCHYICNDAYR
jgi:hypothetical protein